ncbi:MAG TPA: M56 family metallopeptidase, partial [Blastocatellia bacterium]|nr:M56 family metallopeptidase [Blastocatellia bacterium]
MTLHEWLADWSRWLWPLLANHLWQATLFSTLAFAAVLLLRRGPSRARYAIWVIVGLKFAVPSALVALLIAAAGFDMSSRPVSPENEADTLAAVSQFTAPVYETSEADAFTGDSGDHNELYCGLTFVWLSVVTFLFGLWVRRRLLFSQALKAGRAVTSGREAEALDRARTLLGATRRVSLIVSSQVVEPGVWRVLRPAILLPEGMADHLSSAELEAVLAHELIHVARWDNLVSNLHMALCCLLWFHPLLWLIDRRLLVEREQSCDEAVIRLGRGSEVYASSLLKVLRFCLGWKVAGVSYAAGSNLRRRVERIMANHSDGTLRISHRVVIATVAGLVIGFSIAAGLASYGRVVAQVDSSLEGDPQGRVQARQPGRVRGRIPGGVSGAVPGGVSGGVPGG